MSTTVTYRLGCAIHRALPPVLLRLFMGNIASTALSFSIALACVSCNGSGSTDAARTRLESTQQTESDRHHGLTFTTVDFLGATETVLTEISSAGDILGFYIDAKTHGFLRRGSEFVTIDFPVSKLSATTGINGRGDISGFYTDAIGKLHGFLLSGRADCRRDPPPRECFTQIDFPGASDTRARKMNAQGDLVGEYCDSSTTPRCNFIPTLKGNMHGFVLSRGSFSSIDVPGAILTQPWGINPDGQIVGRYYSSDGKHHIFLFSEGQFTSIDFPRAVETAVGRFTDNGGINAHGVIVSDYCDAAPCPSQQTDNLGHVHGFLLRAEERDAYEDGQFASFDFPGAAGTVPFGINARGDIVGAHKDPSGKIHGFLRSRDERHEDNE